MMRLVWLVLVVASCGGPSVPTSEAEDCGSAGRCASMCPGSAAACFWAGYFFQDGRSGPDDPERAFEYYERGCDRGDLRACRAVAVAYLNGIGVKRDPARADTLFLGLADRSQDACKKNDDMACQVAASLFDWGRGVGPDKERAKTLWLRAADAGEAACEAGDRLACSRAAAALGAVRGDGHKAQKDRRRKLERAACDKGEPAVCGQLARALAGESEGLSQEAEELFDRAEKALQASCDRYNVNRCIQLYSMLESRASKRGLEPMLRAIEVADKVCRLGAAWSCQRVATMLKRACSARRQCTEEQRRELERRAFGARLRVINMHETRCRAGRLAGCEGLARELMPSSGSGADEMKTVARELYGRLCAAGRANACYRLASSYRYSGDYTERARGLLYLEKGCDLGDGFSCERAAEAYREGKYVLRDEVRARELAHKACRADSYFCKDAKSR